MGRMQSLQQIALSSKIIVCLSPLHITETSLSKTLPHSWEKKASVESENAQRTQHILIWQDAETGLEVRYEVTCFADYDAAEWVLYFTNNSDRETPILENIRVADFLWDKAAAAECTLYYAEGSHERITDFQPMQKVLAAGESAAFTPFGGRPSDGFLPFFNLVSQSEGIIVALGWTGQWKASFTHTEGGIQIQGGMEAARFKLMPHETVRTPSILALPWNGDAPMTGQNLFRRLLLEHYVPHYDGKPVAPIIAASPHAVIPFAGTGEANMIEIIRNTAAHDLPVDYYWIDAGWFVSPENNWARGVGNFEPDPARFPNGMKPVADAAHAAGMKFLLWFEPERVMPDTWLYTHHRDWLLEPSPTIPDPLRYQYNDKFHLLNLGIPDAEKWLTENVITMIQDVGIDLYRNDFNMYPSFYWQAEEDPDRQGIREIKYVQGLYRYFDSLRQENPQLILDTCASGGRRIDLEMLKRALILTRSDYLWDPTGQQCHTHGLAQWLPITGIGAASPDQYNCRSGYGSHFTLAVDYLSTDNALWDSVRNTLTECSTLAPMFRKDFYPLTPYSTNNDVWMAWQFHDPETQSGIIQAFRRNDCPNDTLTCFLHGLDPQSVYTFTNLDTKETVQFRTKELLNNGFALTLDQKPGSVVFTYKISEGTP
jgi:alpha-galactosidase